MAEDETTTFQYLTKTYRVVRIIALGVVSLVGLLVSIAALDITISPKWTAVSVPLYAVGIFCLVVLALCTIALTWTSILLRNALGAASFYRNKSEKLASLVAGLEDLAYFDPITGAPNSNALRRDLQRQQPGARCLILLDLRNFGEINKKFNHWKGDEYLRNFTQMVTATSRRNEYLFKRRPFKYDDSKPVHADTDDVKAFRKNSGGDEFYILLEGSIAEGLGYLNRLKRRANDFEEMARRILRAEHTFDFQAGLVAIAPNESFDSVAERVSQCLGLAMAPENPLSVYWIDEEMPKLLPGSIEASNVETAKKQFARNKGT